ncbi:MAG: sulfatase [Planctomycetota bacterium]
MKRLLVTVLTVLVYAVSVGASQRRPNILFIVCDDLNTHVSTSGYEPIETPTFDMLARNGMTFSHAFCQYPVCGPSRASLLSGLYPESTGVLDNTADIRQTRPETLSMPQYFKQHGYWTASVGKVFHNLKADHGTVAWDDGGTWFTNDELPVVTIARETFEHEFGSVDQRENRKAWREVMKAALDPLNAQTPPGHGPSGLQDHQHKDGKNARRVTGWLQEKPFGERPFFIALGIQKPHVPFLAPEKYFQRYPRDQIVFHRDRPSLWDTIPSDAAASRYTAFGFKLGVEDEPRRREFMQAYHACVSFIDAQLSLVFDELQTQGFWDDTIIVLTSDHGYHLGDHFLWGKVTLFDIGAKVPFLVRVPGITRPGSRSNAMVELVDIFPTLSELARLDVPSQAQGSSIVPILRDADAEPTKSYAYSVVRRGPSLGYAVRNQYWRYGKWPHGEELYDLTTDPHERNNLAASAAHEPQLAELRRVLTEKQQVASRRRLSD